jgi:pilus assembly protein CpaE
MFKLIAATLDTNLSDRLIHAMDGLASFGRHDPDIYILRDAVAREKPDVVLIDTGPAAGTPQVVRLIEAVRAIEGSHVIMAIGDDTVAQSVLLAIRAGARDFISYDSGLDQLRAAISRHFGQTTRRGKQDGGELIGIFGGNSFFSTNYAVARAAQGEDVVFVDCNLPSTEMGAALDIGLHYTVRNAINDLSRLDRTLLSSTLARHEPSGLHVLPLSLGGEDIGDLTPSAILSMLAALRVVFGTTIINVGGIRHAGIMAELFESATTSFFVINQKFTALRTCKEILQRLSLNTDAMDRITLVVDDYHDEITLGEEQIATAIGLRHSMRLPAAHAALVNALNRGKPLVLHERRHPYSRAIAKLVGATKATPAEPVAERLKLGRVFGLIPRRAI